MTDGAISTSDVRQDPPPAGGFAAILRARTEVIHREAERSGYIADLLRGRGTRTGYAVYLANLLPAYTVMERLLQADTLFPAARAFASPLLFRADALRHDISALGTDGDTDHPVAVLPEAHAYAAAIEAQGHGSGLLAHAYARYLGDLSGGQILQGLLARTLGLTSTQLTVYDFPGVDIGACKLALRSALDSVDPASADAALIVQEAVNAFRHTIAVSTAVSAAMA